MTAQRTFTFGVRIGSALVIALLSLSIASSQTLYWLGTLAEGTLAEGTGVSADGRIVVGFSATQETVNYRAFSWSASTGITQLETPPTDRGSYARGVSADGEVIVGYRVNAQGRFVPARWVNGTLQNIPLPSQGIWGYANGVSGDGSTAVGQFSLGAGRLRAFKYHPSTGSVDL